MVDLMIYILLWLTLRRGGATFSPLTATLATRSPLHVASRLTQGSSSAHPGVDICPVDDRGVITRVSHPVFPIAPGTVIAVRTTARGRWVLVEHAHGIRTSYGHLSSTAVAGGAPVTTDTELGRLGYDPLDPERIVHLHLEAQGPDRRRIRPEALLGVSEGSHTADTVDDLDENVSWA